MVKLRIPTLTCLRCAHRWVPRQTDVRICPKCKNARAFAVLKGWTVADAHVYADDAVSGAETKKLVQKSRLLDVVGGHPTPFAALILRDASRLSRRDGDEAFGELKRIAQAGVEVWFYQD